MSRLKGLLQISGNFEPQIAAPFDARSIVGEYQNLVDPLIWEAKDGTVYTYVGMVVTVTADADVTRNGVYYLSSEDYTVFANWVKIGEGSSSLRTLTYSLTGKTFNVPSTTHGLTNIANREVVNTTTRKPVFVDITVSTGGDIIIESIVNLDGFSLILVGD